MLDIGIFTTAWGDYGQYLPEWVASVQAQVVQPSLVTIVDVGADVGPARKALEASDLRWQLITAPYGGPGDASNRAVAVTQTEWIMHLDADDTLLPHALSDVADLADDADVVSIGAIRGDRIHCFPHVTAEWILTPRHGAYSCAAYRRRLWEKRPYITENSWIDSALWIGFAHFSARFVGTSRPGFVYRQHADSSLHTRSNEEREFAMAQWRRLSREWDP